MEILNLKPQQGEGVYRIGDNEDLVVIEHVCQVPSGKVRSTEYGIIILCTEGRAQFNYDGEMVQIQESDLFVYMANSIASDFMASPDFNCRQIWFKRSELWNMNLYTKAELTDFTYIKLHPVFHISEADYTLLDSYFKLLSNRMNDSTLVFKLGIVRSLLGTMILEMLGMVRRNVQQEKHEKQHHVVSTAFYKQRIIEKFMEMVEQSDGRIRRVDEFASRLNVTPKYLSTILQEVMNRRPSTYIQLFTMKAIEQRLRFSDMTMQEIANDLNFPNASFFGKYFREHAGITPFQYRKKYQSGE